MGNSKQKEGTFNSKNEIMIVNIYSSFVVLII